MSPIGLSWTAKKMSKNSVEVGSIQYVKSHVEDMILVKASVNMEGKEKL